MHHLPSTHATIVDILDDCNVKDLLPSFIQETKTCWPMLMCDDTGKMNITLVSSENSQPIIFPIDSPHSEVIRAAITHRSSLYSCGDDGQIIQWQPTSSTKNPSNANQQQTKSKKKSNNRKPY